MALKIQVTHRDLCEVCGFYNSRCNDVHATFCMEINPANSDNETSLYQGIFLQANCCNSIPDHQITSTDTSNCGESMDIIYTIHADVDTVALNQDSCSSDQDDTHRNHTTDDSRPTIDYEYEAISPASQGNIDTDSTPWLVQRDSIYDALELFYTTNSPCKEYDNYLDRLYDSALEPLMEIDIQHM